MKTNKKVVRLTESKLKQMIAEAVQEVLNEANPFLSAYPSADKSYRSAKGSVDAESRFHIGRGREFENWGDEKIARMVGCNPLDIEWSRKHNWQKPEGMHDNTFEKLGRVLKNLKGRAKSFEANQEKNRISDVGDNYGSPV